MTTARDPLHEPLRLLREASLPAGFEESLAECLAAARPEAKVIRFPGRRRMLLLVAAIALPAAAAAAAAGHYYVQQRSSGTPSTETPNRIEAKPLGHLPRTGFAVPVPPAPPALPAIEELPSPRSQEPVRGLSSAPKLEGRPSAKSQSETVGAAPAANAAPRIEALDPFASKATGSKQSAVTPKGVEVSDSLRKATEQGAARTRDDSVRGARREASSNENRGNDAAQQARERVQARERKGQ